MNSLKSYRLDNDRLTVETRFEPESRQYVLDLRSAHDRLCRTWPDPAQFAEHVRSLSVQLAEDGWELETAQNV